MARSASNAGEDSVVVCRGCDDDDDDHDHDKDDATMDGGRAIDVVVTLSSPSAMLMTSIS